MASTSGMTNPKGRIDLIAAKPVEINPGAWDDIPNPARSPCGACTPRMCAGAHEFMTDVYFLDYNAKVRDVRLVKPHESREGWLAAGTSIACPGEPPRAGFDYNVETGFQWSTFGNPRNPRLGRRGKWGGRFPVQCGARVSACRRMQSAETTDSRVHSGRSTLFSREERISVRSSLSSARQTCCPFSPSSCSIPC